MTVLMEMAAALSSTIESSVLSSSDIVTSAFDQSFSARLVLFHAMHDSQLSKKTFEYLFIGASRDAGRHAFVGTNSVHAGEDVTVDGTKISLKTEASKGIKRHRIHISKFAEARWIRTCQTPVDYCRLTHSKILGHMHQYDRMLSLRSFISRDFIEYHLVEIPIDLLRRIQHLTPESFKDRTSNGSSSANVLDDMGHRLFVLALDGSVEKVTIRELDVDHCIQHARWKISARSSIE